MLLPAGNAASAADSPLRWRWSNPAPHGGNIIDMAYSLPLLLGVQVADRGQIFTSDDLSLWLPRDSGTTNALRSVTFFGSRIVITGQEGTTLYSDDEKSFQFGTLLDGETDDWLEAVTASPNLVVAAGDNGAIYTSNDGINWKRQNSGTSEWLRGAAHGAGRFVVAGDNGTILGSLDGTNWTSRASGVTNHLSRVSFAPGENRFHVVGDFGAALASTNGGATWFLEPTGATNHLVRLASAGGDRVAVGHSEVRLFDDGAWDDQLPKPKGPPDWTFYSAIPRPGFFLIGGQTGLQSEGYQTNGASYFWLTPYDSVRNWLWDATWASHLYVTVGDFGTVMTSGDGVDWTLELIPPSVTNTTFLGIGGNTNLLIAVGDQGAMIYSPNNITNIISTNADGMVITQTVSTLGVFWYPVEPQPTTNVLQGVTALGTNLFVVTGEQGAVLTSSDGTNWTKGSTPTSKLLTGVAAWPGGLVATGDDGALITSPDGFAWDLIPQFTTNWLYKVRYLNDTLVAVGQKGSIFTSADGENWTPRASSTTKWLNDATFIDDTWFVVGTGGAVLTSTNLIDWSNQGTLTTKALYSAVTDGAKLVAVGVEGIILRSPVVPDLTPVSILGYSRFQSTNAPNLAQNIFLFGGHPDQQFLLSADTNLTTSKWNMNTELEIYDGSGLLYYIESFPATNLPTAEFFRTKILE
jgi:photosystem II stability/assembly factor-like uncharacterized protein